MSPQPVVEVVSSPTHVLAVCHACPDRRRLPLDALALRLGVRSFLDEHAGCGPAQVQLPDDLASPALV